MNTSIMIVGVGGQGTLLASRILGRVALNEGHDVKVSEVHGMSQRGGSVVTYVRYGEAVYSPVIDRGGADIILAFEELEAYRYMEYLKTGGTMICNSQNIDPMPVIIGQAAYPTEIAKKMKAAGVKLLEVDAYAAALQAGNAKATNVVLIGLLAKQTDIAKDRWMQAIRETVPPKFLNVNLAAFELGYQL